MSHNIRPIFLPSRARAQTPLEKHLAVHAWKLALNLVFETYNDIIDVACDAWRKLTAQPAKIPSISM